MRRLTTAVQDECVFVKRYRSHKSAVCDLAVSDAGELCATMCHDGTVKIYDVATFDMIVMLRLPFVPGCCAFISKLGAAHKKLAISHLETGEISIYDVGTGSSEAIAKLDALHSSPVTCMAANLASQTVCHLSACCLPFVLACMAATLPREGPVVINLGF